MNSINHKMHDFSVEIRKKKINERISKIRGQLFASENTFYDRQQLQNIISKINSKNAEEFLPQLKLISWYPQTSNDLTKILNIILQCIVESVQKQKKFDDAITILINMTVGTQIYLSSQFLMQIAKMILKPERQCLVLWLLANLLYKKTNQLQMLAQFLVKIQTPKYINSKISNQIIDKSSIVILNYFGCALLSNGQLLPFEQYKLILISLKKIQDLEVQETDWYLSQSLIDHAPCYSKHNYQIFTIGLITKFQEYCRLKKTKLVKNYLEAILVFLDKDKDKDNFQRLLKYGIFKSFNFCLENRSPEVKKLLTDISILIIQQYHQQIDIEGQDFFINLTTQLINILKYSDNLQLSLLTYVDLIFEFAMNKQVEEYINNIVDQTQIISSLSSIVSAAKQNLMQICLSILEKLISISQPIKKQCINYGILNNLSNYHSNNQSINLQIEHILSIWHQKME